MDIDKKPEFYLVTYHDTEHNGDCFDEDRFYTIDELIFELQHSKKSISEGYCDFTKVWVAYDKKLIELCDIT